MKIRLNRRRKQQFVKGEDVARLSITMSVSQKGHFEAEANRRRITLSRVVTDAATNTLPQVCPSIPMNIHSIEITLNDRTRSGFNTFFSVVGRHPNVEIWGHSDDFDIILKSQNLFFLAECHQLIEKCVIRFNGDK